MGIILDICSKRKVGEYATFCTVLTAYAESDFKWDARSKHPVSASGYYSEGVFQQTLPWWKNDHFDVAASTNAFLDQFQPKYGQAVLDCWNVQRWAAPVLDMPKFWAAPATVLDMPKFWAAPETVNYSRRLDSVARLISQRQVV